MISEQDIMQLYQHAAQVEIDLKKLEENRRKLHDLIKTTREDRCKLMDKIRTLHQEISEVNIQKIDPYEHAPDTVTRVK